MRKLGTWIVLVSFVLWIFPLGVFIDISLEDVLCRGQRAICMCSKNFQKPSSNDSTKVGPVTQIQKQYRSAMSISQHFLVDVRSRGIVYDISRFIILDSFRYTSPALKPQEHVPKV